MSLSPHDHAPIRVQILSDLHAEHGHHAIPNPADLATGADIVILAGDIAAAPDAVEMVTRLFPGAPALTLIGGNHEHYGLGRSIDQGLFAMRREAARLATEKQRIVVLENSAAVFRVRGADVRVLGATFWTDYGLRHRSITDAAICRNPINDYRMILGSAGGLFTTHEAATRHAASRAFLAAALSEEYLEGPTIIVTHHLPSIRSVAGQFRHEPKSGAFASHADDLVGMGAALWVHGHTHDSCAWRNGERGTLVMCNPGGYAREHGDRENLSSIRSCAWSS